MKTTPATPTQKPAGVCGKSEMSIEQVDSFTLQAEFRYLVVFTAGLLSSSPRNQLEGFRPFNGAEYQTADTVIRLSRGKDVEARAVGMSRFISNISGFISSRTAMELILCFDSMVECLWLISRADYMIYRQNGRRASRLLTLSIWRLDQEDNMAMSGLCFFLLISIMSRLA